MNRNSSESINKSGLRSPKQPTANYSTRQAPRPMAESLELAEPTGSTRGLGPDNELASPLGTINEQNKQEQVSRRAPIPHRSPLGQSGDQAALQLEEEPMPGSQAYFEDQSSDMYESRNSQDSSERVEGLRRQRDGKTESPERVPDIYQ